MAEKQVEEIWILSPVDQILTNYLALPPIKKLADVLPTPKKVLTALGLPTLDEVVIEAADKFEEAIKKPLR